MSPSTVHRETLFLILQFLDYMNYRSAMHKLEQESGIYFNMSYFEDMVINGEWEDLEKYLFGFTKIDANCYSTKIFEEIRMRVCFEALHKDHKDTVSARLNLLVHLKRLIECNPLFRDKLQFPTFLKPRLLKLLKQSLKWQHHCCKNPRPKPLLKTLFVDHTCDQPSDARAPSTVTPTPVALAGRVENPSTISHPSSSASPVGSNATYVSANLELPRTASTNNSTMCHPTTDYEHVQKRSRPFLSQVSNQPIAILPVTHTNQSYQRSSYSADDLPKNVVRTINQGSTVKSMDFHPVSEILLLVGTDIGNTMIWEIDSGKMIAIRSFKAWELSGCSLRFQEVLTRNSYSSVNRVAWSPDGALIGVAYSKQIVHIYSYHGGNDLRNHLEIDAHVGSVGDLAFSNPGKRLCVVTCGEDKLIKVWDAFTGSKQYIFQGHEAPIYSLCPHKRNIQHLLSAAVDGKIKTWLIYGQIFRIDEFHVAGPDHSFTRFSYSDDGTRLFACWTNTAGDSALLEWDVDDNDVKHVYSGIEKPSMGIVQFDTSKNRFLVAGHDFCVKFWDMDNGGHLLSTYADCGLLESPCVKFNKEGSLLAVSAEGNGLKILANADGIKLIRADENGTFVALSDASEAGMRAFGSGHSTVGTGIEEGSAPTATMVVTSADNRSLVNVAPRIAEINEISKCRSLRLPDNTTTTRVSRLQYTNSGHRILMLASNGVHKLWIRKRDDQNLLVKATASVEPDLWQIPSGVLMTNDTSEVNSADVVGCFALSNSDCLLSASGGEITLYETMTFERVKTFMPPPPAATFLEFCPHYNNIVAIGMEDGSIRIYSLQLNEVITQLKGHKDRITGLAFSHYQRVLVSSGADCQLVVWNRWTSLSGVRRHAQACQRLPTPNEQRSSLADVHIQFHLNQTHLLAVYKTQIAIYEVPKLQLLKQRFLPLEASDSITHATYSCDSKSIYVSFDTGSVGVLAASTLTLRCLIKPTAYLHPYPRVYPLVIAAHPSEPNQFALGLTNGSVYVLEPLESKGEWDSSPLNDQTDERAIGFIRDF